jgi:hypothetical protein
MIRPPPAHGLPSDLSHRPRGASDETRVAYLLQIRTAGRFEPSRGARTDHPTIGSTGTDPGWISYPLSRRWLFSVVGQGV